MVYRVRKQLVEEGFEAVLSRKQRATPAIARIFDEAKLIALGLFQTSQGTRTLDLAAVGEKGRGTPNCRSRQQLDDWAGAKKNILQPHRRQCWVIPPKANSAFVAAMEDVLAVYTRPRDCPRSSVGVPGRELEAKQLLAKRACRSR